MSIANAIDKLCRSEKLLAEGVGLSKATFWLWF